MLRNDVYDRAHSYKAKLEFRHDKTILIKKLEPFDKVLLYDSKLHLFAGKLKSHWIGPFIIKTIFPHGVVEIVDPKNGCNFKVNEKHLKPFLDDF